MKWTNIHYPSIFSSLQPTVRAKAIEIGNLLMKYGYKKDQIVGIALHKAKEELRFNRFAY